MIPVNNESGEVGRFADLHVHSDHSDGHFSAAYLPELAARHGIAALALTDHDTVAGLKAFTKACRQAGIEGIPGVECSCSFEGTEVHVLGYYVNAHWPALRALTEAVGAQRRQMIGELCKRYAAAGYPLEQADYARPDRAFVERVHVARAAKMRYANMEEVDPYSRDLMAYFATDPAEVVKVVRDAGGVAVLAHPWVYNDATGADLLPRLIEHLLPSGLDGLELSETKCGAEKSAEITQAAGAHGLITTGGSDFHGLPPGTGCGHRPWTRHRFPYAQLAPLKERLERLERRQA